MSQMFFGKYWNKVHSKTCSESVKHQEGAHSTHPPRESQHKLLLYSSTLCIQDYRNTLHFTALGYLYQADFHTAFQQIISRNLNSCPTKVMKDLMVVWGSINFLGLELSCHRLTRNFLRSLQFVMIPLWMTTNSKRKKIGMYFFMGSTKLRYLIQNTKLQGKKSLEVHLKPPATAFRRTVYHNMDN